MFLLSNVLMSFFWGSSYWKVKRKQSQQIKCNRCIHEMVFQEHKHYFLGTSFSQKMLQSSMYSPFFILENLPMRKKITIHCLFWIFWYQYQRMVLKYLFTTTQLLVGWILTSIVSFTTNIKLVWFLACYRILDELCVVLCPSQAIEFFYFPVYVMLVYFVLIKRK